MTRNKIMDQRTYVMGVLADALDIWARSTDYGCELALLWRHRFSAAERQKSHELFTTIYEEVCMWLNSGTHEHMAKVDALLDPETGNNGVCLLETLTRIYEF